MSVRSVQDSFVSTKRSRIDIQSYKVLQQTPMSYARVLFCYYEGMEQPFKLLNYPVQFWINYVTVVAYGAGFWWRQRKTLRKVCFHFIIARHESVLFSFGWMKRIKKCLKVSCIILFYHQMLYNLTHCLTCWVNKLALVFVNGSTHLSCFVMLSPNPRSFFDIVDENAYGTYATEVTLWFHSEWQLKLVYGNHQDITGGFVPVHCCRW